nr:F-box/LRR-repeat protein 17-like [Tanacetum cinerariifolium]
MLKLFNLREKYDIEMFNLDIRSNSNSDSDSQVSPNSKLHLIHQKLFIKHARLKKLSLWGCSSLDSLYLNCPNLSELNLNSCNALLPEKLVLQCSKLEIVHAVGCPDVVVQAVQTQVSNDPAPSEDSYSRKRMADGSKRVGIPFSFSQPVSYKTDVDPTGAKMSGLVNWSIRIGIKWVFLSIYQHFSKVNDMV